MATYTTNINLKKPTTSEMYNVLDWNDNSDKIDTAIGTLNSQLASKITTGTMVVACSAGKTQISYANLPSGKPDSQGKFLQSLYQAVNHGSTAEMTTVCIDGVDLIIQTATAQNVTIRWFYFGTVT